MSTTITKAADIERKWYVIDASKYTLGRLSAKVASILRGKHKPTFVPFLDCGDNVIVINAKDVKLTGNKLEQKEYVRHSAYIGGVKKETLKVALEKHPERVIEHAVKGMLPKAALGYAMYKKLHVYAGPEHNHAAQKPEELNF